MKLEVTAHEGLAASERPFEALEQQQKEEQAMSLQHQSDHAHRSSLQDWLWSRTGIVTCAAVAILGFLVYTGHTAHLLGFAPYLLLLACPLMHIFMHRGHGHHHHRDNRDMDEKGGR